MKQTLLNRDSLTDSIRSLLEGRSDVVDEDTLDEYVSCIVDGIMDDMDAYAHRKDKSICGNFKQIDRNWEWDHEHFVGTPSFDEIVCLADVGCLTDDELSHVQSWALEWFFDAFGTFGITYNYDDFCAELKYAEDVA